MPSAMNLGRDKAIARQYGSLPDPWGDPALPEKDRQVVLAILLESYLEHETGGEALVTS